MANWKSWLQLPSKSADPKPFYAALAAGMAVVVVGGSLLVGGGEVSELADQHEALSAQLAELDQHIAEKQTANDAEQKEAVIEATGLDPALIAVDRTAATSYFGAAFNWSSGAEYDQARENYETSLGEGNSFTETYFPENTKIETSSGELNFIDFESLRTKMDDMVVVPTVAEGNRIRYVAFVQYYMFKDAEDTNNTDALTPSNAIIEFTASGDPDGERTVSEVEAWSGFSSTLDAAS